MSMDDLRKHQHFAISIEQALRIANKEVINPIVGVLTTGRVVAVAVEVAKRRAAYIAATLRLGEAGVHHPSGEELANLRSAYEEGREAFSALMTSIERGYVDCPSE